MKIQVQGSGSGSKIEAKRRTQMANFNALDNINMSKQSDNTQCAAMHSMLWSKNTC